LAELKKKRKKEKKEEIGHSRVAFVEYIRTKGQLKDDQKDVEDTRPNIPEPSMQLSDHHP